MEHYTPQQRAEIVQLYIQNNFSNVQTQRAFRKKFNVKSAPDVKTIKKLYAKFISGGLRDASHASRKRTSRSRENIDAVRASVERSPRTSGVRRSLQMGIPRTTLRRIMRIDLGIFPYKIQLAHQLKPPDKVRRLNYGNWVVQMAEEHDDFWRKIIMSDEAHFTLNGTVNKQNCRFYAAENPELFEEQPLYDQKVTVWCGICADKVIGPYFYENDDGATVTVNAERYRAMIRDYVMPILEGNDMEDYWFQQDGATCHTAGATIDFLKPLFPNRLISKKGDFDWPPRSPDLTAPDFFLWGYLKSKVYINKPKTLAQLKNNIRREIAAIPVEMLAKTMENAEKRAHCHQRKRRPFTRYHFQKVIGKNLLESK